MKKKLLVLLLLLMGVTSFVQYTSIPDENFEKKLIDLGIDETFLDGRVLTSRISSIKNLDISFSKIRDLTGIENFMSLELLSCESNSITKLNLSRNTKLISIDCRNNQLTALDFSTLPLLTAVFCSENEIMSLDISQNPLIAGLFCAKNKLISLNLKNGNNTKFQDVFCDFRYNPHLSCIEVDNAAYSNTNWKDWKDNKALFSNGCGWVHDKLHLSKKELF